MPAASLPLTLAAVMLALAVVVLPAWAPFLVADRIRALLSWPTDSLAINYVVVGLGVTLAQGVAYLLVAAALGGVSTSQGPVPLFGALFGANLLVPLVGWLVAAVVLPRRGAWDPTGDGVDGRLVLAVGGVWYAVLVSVVGVIAVFVLTFLYLPT